MKRIIFLVLTASIISFTGYSQGCVAIRNLAGFGQFAQLGYGQSTDKWALDINNRYFNSSQVYSLSNPQPWDGLTIYELTTNFEVSRVLQNGWAIALDVPISTNSITSIIEHRSGYRHTTSAYGLGDIRFTVY